MSHRVPEFEMFKRMFVTDTTGISIEEFAKRSGLPNIEAFVQYMLQYDWTFERDNVQKAMGAKMPEIMERLAVGDITQRLIEINALKTRAFEEAMKKTFKDAGQAISSYIELEKLERLIMGQSTESIKIEDLDKYMIGVAMIIRRNIPEGPMLDSLIGELSSFSFSDAKRQDFNTPGLQN